MKLKVLFAGCILLFAFILKTDAGYKDIHLHKSKNLPTAPFSAAMLQLFTPSFEQPPLHMQASDGPGENGKETIKKTIVIDPGHGVWDKGAIAGDGATKETDLNWTYALAVKDMLDKSQYHVVLTREKETTCQDVAERYAELQCRVDLVKQNKADLYVSIHANSDPSSSVEGMEVYYNETDTIGAKNLFAEESKKLAHIVYDHMKNSLGMEGRGVRPGNLYVTRTNTVPAILIEIGYLSNRHDFHLIQQEQTKTTYAEQLTAAITEYFK